MVGSFNLQFIPNKSFGEEKNQTSKQFNDTYTSRDFSNADDRMMSFIWSIARLIFLSTNEI